MVAPVTAVVNAYFAAVNARDWVTLPRLFAEDAELRAPGAPIRHGRAAIAAHFPPLLAGFVKGHDDVVRVTVADGGVVTAEVTFRGRTVGGAEVEFDAVDIFDVADGLIHRLSIWYDTREVLVQLTPKH